MALSARGISQGIQLQYEWKRGWLGGAMVLGKLPVPGRPAVWIRVGQGPTALAVGAGGGCLDIFTLIYHFSPLSPSLWETARYRLKYCLKGPLNPKQPTNQHEWKISIYIKYFCKKKLTIGEEWLYQLGVFHKLVDLPKAKGRGNLLSNNIKINQTDNC